MHYKAKPKANILSQLSLAKWLILVHNKVNRYHEKPEWTLDQFLDYAEAKYEEEVVYIKEYSSGEIDGFTVQGAYDKERWNELSRKEKTEAILSYPNTVFQLGEIYFFDGDRFSRVTMS